MCQGILGSASFHESLFEIDQDMAAAAGRGTCSCGGPLHVSNYPRKPRGAPAGVGGRDHDLRHSFCCGRDGCRKRLTPVSVRFLASRVYTSVIVALAVMMTQGPSAKRVGLVAAELSVDPRTVVRWVAMWKDEVPRTRCWQELRGRLAGSVDSRHLPFAVHELIQAEDDEDRWIRLLHLFRDLSQTELMQARTARVA